MALMLVAASPSGTICMVVPQVHSICTKWLDRQKHLSGHFQETKETPGLVDKYQLEKNCSMDIKYVRIMLYGIKEPGISFEKNREGSFIWLFSHHAMLGMVSHHDNICICDTNFELDPWTWYSYQYSNSFVFSLSPTLDDFLRVSSFPPKLNSKSQCYVRSLQLTQNWSMFNRELITGGC